MKHYLKIRIQYQRKELKLIHQKKKIIQLV